MIDILNSQELLSLRATSDELYRVVRNSDRRRFQVKQESEVSMIRAVQGHSMSFVEASRIMERIGVDGNPAPVRCVHGTSAENMESILARGLIAGGLRSRRNQIHLFPCEEQTGRHPRLRHRYQIAVHVEVRRAAEDGVVFYRSANDLILTSGVYGMLDARYIVAIQRLRDDRWLFEKDQARAT